MKQIDIDAKLQEWFQEQEGYSLRSERFYDSLDQFTNKAALASSLVRWLEAAYFHGIKTAAHESSDTLLDYATTLAGCHPESKTPTAAYDEAAKSLIEYWKEVLGDDYE